MYQEMTKKQMIQTIQNRAIEKMWESFRMKYPFIVYVSRDKSVEEDSETPKED